ncbi:MAG TPA: hypothetical protein VFL42_04840, partial [Terriglobales bacterium]|nr:hypothetical protein [Terriglobales bacterium]
MGTFAGAGIALGLTWVDSFLVANGTPPEGTYLDEILAGMLAAGLVLVLDFYYADKLRRLREAAKLVRQLNHYIRNSLQVILYSNTTQPDPVAREALTKAVRRIEWV